MLNWQAKQHLLVGLLMAVLVSRWCRRRFWRVAFARNHWLLNSNLCPSRSCIWCIHRDWLRSTPSRSLLRPERREKFRENIELTTIRRRSYQPLEFQSKKGDNEENSPNHREQNQGQPEYSRFLGIHATQLHREMTTKVSSKSCVRRSIGDRWIRTWPDSKTQCEAPLSST